MAAAAGAGIVRVRVRVRVGVWMRVRVRVGARVRARARVRVRVRRASSCRGLSTPQEALAAHVKKEPKCAPALAKYRGHIREI